MSTTSYAFIFTLVGIALGWVACSIAGFYRLVEERSYWMKLHESDDSRAILLTCEIERLRRSMVEVARYVAGCVRKEPVP
jgi:hypothetical protein